jgi:hypothetical protein
VESFVRCNSIDPPKYDRSVPHWAMLRVRGLRTDEAEHMSYPQVPGLRTSTSEDATPTLPTRYLHTHRPDATCTNGTQPQSDHDIDIDIYMPDDNRVTNHQLMHVAA